MIEISTPDPDSNGLSEVKENVCLAGLYVTDAARWAALSLHETLPLSCGMGVAVGTHDSRCAEAASAAAVGAAPDNPPGALVQQKKLHGCPGFVSKVRTRSASWRTAGAGVGRIARRRRACRSAPHQAGFTTMSLYATPLLSPLREKVAT